MQYLPRLSYSQAIYFESITINNNTIMRNATAGVSQQVCIMRPSSWTRLPLLQRIAFPIHGLLLPFQL